MDSGRAEALTGEAEPLTATWRPGAGLPLGAGPGLAMPPATTEISGAMPAQPQKVG